MRLSLLVASLLIVSLSFVPSSFAQKGILGRGSSARRPLHRHPTLFGMLRRNNDIRRRAGLQPQRMNPALTKAAQDHANYMAQTGQFSHYVNLGPSGRAQKYGFQGGGVRENIAMGTHSIDGAFGMWQASSPHYASIVSGTTEAGFGYAVGPSGQGYWVGVYATSFGDDSETEEQIAAALAEEAKRKEEEKNAAAQQSTESNAQTAKAEAAGTQAANGDPASSNAAAANANSEAGNAKPAETAPASNAAPGNTPATPKPTGPTT